MGYGEYTKTRDKATKETRAHTPSQNFFRYWPMKMTERM